MIRIGFLQFSIPCWDFFVPNWFILESSFVFSIHQPDYFEWHDFSNSLRAQTQFLVLTFNTKHLTIQIVRRLKLAVVTWHGFTPSHIYKEGTIQSLETLRDHPSVNRIILDAKDHKGVLHDGIEASVKSTIDYLGIAHGNYRVAVIAPIDVLAKSSYRLYVELLNNALKKRFVVRQFDTMKAALAWLIKPKFLLLFGKEK